MGRISEEEKLERVEYISTHPHADGVNLKLSNGVTDTTWIVVPTELARMIHRYLTSNG